MKAITLTKIAKAADVSVTYIHYLVKAEKRPNWKRAKQLARITGTNPVLWLEGTEQEIKTALGIPLKANESKAA